MKRVLVFILILTFVLLAVQVPTVAYAAHYGTWTLGQGRRVVSTRTAYETECAYTAGFNSPEDMCVCDDRIMVADTGNSRIVVLDSDGGYVTEFGTNELQAPYGITERDGIIYVADRSLKAVVLYDAQSYEHQKSIFKPTSAVIGDNTPFVPLKVAVSGTGDIYVVSEGCVKGVIGLNFDGEFTGFIGANKTEVSVQSVLQDIFFSEAQKETLIKAAPRSPTFLTISEQGLVYTVTNGAASETVKKLNTQGTAIMSTRFNLSNTVAICLDSSDNIFSVTSDGYVSISNGYGELLFVFGGNDYAERLGSINVPSAISLFGTDLLVLDKGYNMILRYSRTEFADTVFAAVDYYKDGLYLDGESLWQDILLANSNFTLSYKALGMASMRKGEYATALGQFRLAEDKDGYSNAYWEIRNEWLQKYMGVLIICILAVVLVVATVKQLRKRTKLLDTAYERADRFFGLKYIKQVLFMRRFSRKTPDAVYEVKYYEGASPLSATILLVWFVLLQVLSVTVKGYLFNNADVYNTQIVKMILLSLLPVGLFTLSNYFVSNITEGEGKLKHVFIVAVYGLSPYLLLALPTFILSNFLTYNESVIMDLLQFVMIAWCAAAYVRGIAELHDYSFGGTVKNIILTLFAALMLLLFVFIAYMLASQLFGYLGEVITEVFN